MSDLGSIRKAQLNQNATFWFQAPVPLDTGTAPVLTVRLPAGDETPAVTNILGEQTVTAIGTDLRTLTLNAPPANVVGVQGPYGHAFLRTADSGTFSVRVVEIEGATARLADSLPRNVADASSAQLQFAWWSAPLTTAAPNITGTAQRNVPWDVIYTADLGDDIPDEAGGILRGLLHVVRFPFDPGATTARLVDRFQKLGQVSTRRQVDWSAQLDAGLRELVGWVRASVAPDNNEDQVLGAMLLDTHLYLAAAVAIEETNFDQAQQYRTRARDLYDIAMRVVPWIDDDDDGVVDAGEADEQVSGPRILRGFTTARDRSFRIGGDH